MSKLDISPTSANSDRTVQPYADGPRGVDTASAAPLAEQALAQPPIDLEASGAWLTWSDGPPALDGAGPASQAAADADVLLALAQAAADEDVAADIIAELAALAETEPAAGGEQSAPTPGGGNHLFAAFDPGELLHGLKPADLLGPSDLYLQAEGDVLRAGAGGDFVGSVRSASAGGSAGAGALHGAGHSQGDGETDVGRGDGQQAHGGTPGDSPAGDAGSIDDDRPVSPSGNGQGAGGSSGLGDGSNPGQGGSHAQGNNGGSDNPGGGNAGEGNSDGANPGNGNGGNSANAGTGGQGGSQGQGNNGGDGGADAGNGNGNNPNAGGGNGNGSGNNANAGGGNGNGNGNSANAGGGANHSGMGDGSNPGQGSQHSNSGNQGQNNPGGGDDGQGGGFLTLDQLLPPPEVNAQG